MFGWETAVGCVVAIACLTFIPQLRITERREWFLAVISIAVFAMWQLEGLLITLGMTAIAWLSMPGGMKGGTSKPFIPKSIGVILLLIPLIASKILHNLLVPDVEYDFSRSFDMVGLSFTTFRLIGVLLDSSALKISVSPSRMAFLSLFFPTVPSGPITTLNSLKYLDGGENWRSEIIPASERILIGLGRKFILADSIKQFVIHPWITQGVGQLDPYQCIVLPVALGVYVYWDFQGYCDVAIGIARLMGYRLPENFNRPYASRNLVDFWRRWHITLSEWIRIRLMMKISGRRAGIWRLSVATLISMVLCGLWHGIGYGYLVWGIWHGIGLVMLHLFDEAKKRSQILRDAAQRIFVPLVSTILTFIYVSIGWVWFFLPPKDWSTIFKRGMQWSGNRAIDFLVPLGVAIALLSIHLAWDSGKRLWNSFPLIVRRTAIAGLLGLVMYAVLYRQGVSHEFIYTQF